jgi:NAD(P)-dependent dehydrogenase (short-subunit alcohol dehydrogenase family)
MMIEGKTVLVTGANRGIGRALVEEAWSLAERWRTGAVTAFERQNASVMPVDPLAA